MAQRSLTVPGPNGPIVIIFPGTVAEEAIEVLVDEEGQLLVKYPSETEGKKVRLNCTAAEVNA